MLLKKLRQSQLQKENVVQKVQLGAGPGGERCCAGPQCGRAELMVLRPSSAAFEVVLALGRALGSVGLLQPCSSASPALHRASVAAFPPPGV